MKKRILVLGWEFPPNSWGGLGTACYGLVKGLLENGAEVSLMLPNKQKSLLKNLKIISASDLNIKKKTGKAKESKFSSKRIFNNLYTALIRKINFYTKASLELIYHTDFDLIHAHDWMTFKAAIQLKKLTGKPLVVHVHSTEVDRQGKSDAKKRIYNNEKKKRVYDIEKAGMLYADKVITVSNFTKKRIEKFYGIDGKKIKVVHNAILCNQKETKKSVPLPKKVDKIFQGKLPIVLFLGRLTAQKGPEYFISLAHKVLQKQQKVRFVVVGDGDMKDKLKKRVKRLGINKNVLFTGYLQSFLVDKIYQASYMYVMPSVCEPFGLAPLEAMRNKVPVVLSKDCGVCEIINNCVKVDYRNIDQMADKVIKLLDFPKLHRKLAEGVWDGGRFCVLLD